MTKAKPNPFQRWQTFLKSHPASGADFQSNYRQLLAEFAKNEEVTPDQLQILERIGAAFNRWYSAPAPVDPSPLTEWISVYRESKGRIDASVLRAVLSSLPRNAPSVDPMTLTVECPDAASLAMLIEAKLLKTVDLSRVAKGQPERFYDSFGLDVLLSKGSPPPRTVWTQFAKGKDRDPPKLPPSEALVDAYILDSAADSSSWLVGFLNQNSDRTIAVLLQVLRDPAATSKLVRFLGAPSIGAKGKRKKELAAGGALALELMDVCESSVVEGKRTAPFASWAISQLLLDAYGPHSPFSESTGKRIAQTAQRVLHARLLSALRSADDGAADDEAPFVAMSQGLHMIIQEYLETLPTGSSDSGAGDRVARFQRHIGRKEVALEVLLLLDGERPSVSRESLEAVLFNVGCRALGDMNSTVIFDSHRHEAIAPDVLPEDEAIVVLPGWQLGDDDNAVVLRKAKVKPRDL